TPQPNTNDPDPTPQTIEAISAFTATLHNTATSYTTPLVDRAHTLTTNATNLERQQLDVEKSTAALAKQNDALARVAEEARLGLKEIGDVQNWAEVIERELLVLEDVVGGWRGWFWGEGEVGKGKGKDDGVRNGGEGQGESESQGGAEGGKGSGWLKWW
ncbi:hypothetical protein BO94DRAFT_490515, partial [Aspergillus sclerotioniger CBS 115572]